MKTTHPLFIAIIAGGLAALTTFVVKAGAQSNPDFAEPSTVETAIFAGGCFWCVESDFDKVDGVVETVSGYIGGRSANPTYYNHTADGHYEAVKISYDPSKVEYEELLDYFFRHVDPTDAGGQFCDRGDSYRTAVFVDSLEERGAAEAEIAEIDASGVLPAPIVTKVIDAEEFWPAEKYHQDYYKKNSLKYSYYRRACGRDARVKALWGEKSSS